MLSRTFDKQPVWKVKFLYSVENLRPVHDEPWEPIYIRPCSKGLLSSICDILMLKN